MATLSEITNLFSNLALNLQSTVHQQQEEESSLNLSISKLTQSLNVSDDSRVRVLDAALSLMCFKAPRVFESVIEYSVSTIVSVLSSSITCKTLRFEEEETLQIGSSISRCDCLELIRVFNDVAPKLKEHGKPSHLLLYAIVRAAVSASKYENFGPFVCIRHDKSSDGRSTAISKLLCHLPKEFSVHSPEMPLRLLFWYLDPLTLKHDITEILQESMKRPFLSLGKEFYERMEWRSILICLVLSPIMFINARSLLHHWFLLKGLGSILGLLIELISMILDVISRPTWWGIPLEMGSKLPFSNAYFPYKNHLLRTLAGPISLESFLQLVRGTSKSISLVRKQSDPTVKPSAAKVAFIDHKSIWALTISFPDWFCFASVLLFSENHSLQENFQLSCTSWVRQIGKRHGIESTAAAAARYIAWILSPINESQQDLLFDNLTKISECWTSKQVDSGISEKGNAGYRNKLKKPKFCNSKEDFTLGNENDCQPINLWLKQFQNIMNYVNESVDNSASCEAKQHVLVTEHNLLFRRIPLGILIGCSSYVNEHGCELLLHYAATGRILQSVVTKSASLNYVKQNSVGPENSIMTSNKCGKKEAVLGASLVFSLTDIVEKMSSSLFVAEQNGVDFVCQLKLRVGRYLIKCIERLMQPNIDEDEVVLLIDLHDRLKRWRHQGQEVSELNKDLDDAIKNLNHKLSL